MLGECKFDQRLERKGGRKGCNSGWKLEIYFGLKILKWQERKILTCKYEPNWTTPWGRTGITEIVCITMIYKEFNQVTQNKDISTKSRLLYLDARWKLLRKLLQNLTKPPDMEAIVSIIGTRNQYHYILASPNWKNLASSQSKFLTLAGFSQLLNSIE